jgi:hypothetical protein
VLENWSLTLKEEHRLRLFENMVLRRIISPKSGEVLGGWKRMHNEELHNLYSSPMIKTRRRRRFVLHVARIGAECI